MVHQMETLYVEEKVRVWKQRKEAGWETSKEWRVWTGQGVAWGWD